MDKTVIPEKDSVEEEVPENDTSGEAQSVDVEMEKTKSDTPSRAAKPDEADEELTKRPSMKPEEGDNICASCGFSAKCPRSLKIHHARRHGKNTNNTNRTAKPAEKSENVPDASPVAIQQEVDMETDSATEVKQKQKSDELRLEAGDNSMNTKSLTGKETVSDKKQADQEKAVHPQERRVSKRTPKPKIIHSCNYCGQEFRDKAPLDVHIQRYHTKDVPYTCKYILFSSLISVDIQLHI